MLVDAAASARSPPRQTTVEGHVVDKTLNGRELSMFFTAVIFSLQHDAIRAPQEHMLE
jgi:hypothetical protein